MCEAFNQEIPDIVCNLEIPDIVCNQEIPDLRFNEETPDIGTVQIGSATCEVLLPVMELQLGLQN